MARHRTGHLLFIGLLTAAATGATEAASNHTGRAQREASPARVRSSDAAVSPLLRDGRARSATFAALLDRLESAAVLIYVEPGRCRRTDVVRLSGCLIDLGSTSGLRHLRIIVDISGPSRRVIATIGHELQHAVEIVDADGPNGADARPVEMRPGVIETAAAERVGRLIDAELGASARKGGTQ